MFGAPREPVKRHGPGRPATDTGAVSHVLHAIIGGAMDEPAGKATIFERLERFAATRQATVLIGAWGMAEAIVLPVVPDVALYLLAMAAPRHAARLFAAAVVGALAGSAVLAGLMTVDPGAARSLMLAIPGISPQMLQAAERAFAGGDVLGFVGFGPGTPVKVYIVAWILAGGSPVLLPVGVVVNRLTRMGPGVLVTAIIGRLVPGLLRRHERLVLAVYIGLWVLTYVLYFA
jgi:hypothetical protein